MSTGEAVANEPRLFVGRIPLECNEDDLWPLFNRHVLYDRWAEAEAAAEYLDGSKVLCGMHGRPLVVGFANPRRMSVGYGSELGYSPKKLFVGQVPRHVTEDQLRAFFEPYGVVEECSILRSVKGQSSGCGFVRFSRWADAELAIEVSNGKLKIGNSDVPLVVKFADAKRKTLVSAGFIPTATGGKVVLSNGPKSADWTNIDKAVRNQILQNSINSAYLTSQLASIQSYVSHGYQNSNLLANSFYKNQISKNLKLKDGSVNNRQNETNIIESVPNSDPSASIPSHLLSSAPHLTLVNANPTCLETSSHVGMLGLDSSNPNSVMGLDGSKIDSALHDQDLVRKISRLGLGVMPPNDSMSQGFANNSCSNVGPMSPFNPLGANGQANDSLMLREFNNLGMINPLIIPRSLDSLLLRNSRGNFPFSQKLSIDDSYNEWKLFVGQVPIKESEEGLWILFSPIGQILELYILRNNNNKSRGCAFVTYLTKDMADTAISQLNGWKMLNGKALVVKYADRANMSTSIGIRNFHKSDNTSTQAATPVSGATGITNSNMNGNNTNNNGVA